MSASSGSRSVVQQIVRALDPAVVPQVLAEYGRAPPLQWPGADRHIVLVGHRSAGKSTLLPMVGPLTGRATVDLDRALEQRAGRSISEWIRADAAGFRQAERETFTSLPPGQVVAAGGGFLALHADLLRAHLAVLVPITFEAYCARLSKDATRPRLRPELPLEDELRTVFFEREALHARSQTVALGAFLRAAADRTA